MHVKNETLNVFNCILYSLSVRYLCASMCFLSLFPRSIQQERRTGGVSSIHCVIIYWFSLLSHEALIFPQWETKVRVKPPRIIKLYIWNTFIKPLSIILYRRQTLLDCTDLKSPCNLKGIHFLFFLLLDINHNKKKKKNNKTLYCLSPFSHYPFPLHLPSISIPFSLSLSFCFSSYFLISFSLHPHLDKQLVPLVAYISHS